MNSERTTRTRAQWSGLLDAAQVAVTVAFPVALGLPWWTGHDDRYPPTGVTTGWGSFQADYPGSVALGPLIAMVLLLVAFLMRRAWAAYLAAALTVVFELIAVVVVTHVQGFGPHVLTIDAGFWISLGLLTTAGCLTVWNVLVDQ